MKTTFKQAMQALLNGTPVVVRVSKDEKFYTYSHIEDIHTINFHEINNGEWRILDIAEMPDIELLRNYIDQLSDESDGQMAETYEREILKRMGATK